MAAGEDQPKTIVGYFGGVIVRRLKDLRRCIRLQLFFQARPAADVIDSLVTSGLDDPGAR